MHRGSRSCVQHHRKRKKPHTNKEAKMQLSGTFSFFPFSEHLQTSCVSEPHSYCLASLTWSHLQTAPKHLGQDWSVWMRTCHHPLLSQAVPGWILTPRFLHSPSFFMLCSLESSLDFTVLGKQGTTYRKGSEWTMQTLVLGGTWLQPSILHAKKSTNPSTDIFI